MTWNLLQTSLTLNKIYPVFMFYVIAHIIGNYRGVVGGGVGVVEGGFSLHCTPAASVLSQSC